MRPRILPAALFALVPMLPSACGDSCFGGGTWISLVRGRRRIRDVRVGDVVQSFDVRTGRLEARPVLRVFAHGPRAAGRLRGGDGSGPNAVTGNHPIFLEDTGTFERADELDRARSRRRGLYWNQRDLIAIDLEPFECDSSSELADVYNLSVADTETYFADGLLVHNKSDCEGPTCNLDGSGGVLLGTGGHGTGGFNLGGDGPGPSGGASPFGGSSGSAGEPNGAGTAGVAGGLP